MGLEPTRPCEHQPLKLASLPISPRGQKIKKSQHQNPSNPCHTMSSSQNKKSRFTNPRKELRTPTQNIEPYMTNLNQKNLRENKSIYEGTEEIESSYFDRMGREFPSVEKVSM